MYLVKFDYRFYYFVFFCFVLLQILLVKVLYDINPEVGENSELKSKNKRIHFLNISISDHEYDQLFKDFCRIESNKTIYIQNVRASKDYIGIFIPVYNLYSNLLNSTLHQLSSTSQILKLTNSITLVFDMSKKNCKLATSISNTFKFDIKIGFLKILRLSILYKSLYNPKDNYKYKKKIKKDKINFFNYSLISNFAFNSVQNISINSFSNSEINIYLMYLFSNLFNNSFEYYLHLSETSKMPNDYLALIVDFLLKKEITSRRSWFFVEFGSQDFPSGLAVRALEVKRFATFILNMGGGISKVNNKITFNSKGIGSSASLIDIYNIYLNILSQNHRIIYLPPIFHSTDPKLLSLPDPNPLGHVFTTFNILNNQNLILNDGGLVVNQLKSGDQIVILFEQDIVLDSIQWSVTVDCNGKNLVLSTNKNFQYFKTYEDSNRFKINETYKSLEYRSEISENKVNYGGKKFKNKLDRFDITKNKNISVNRLNFDRKKKILDIENSYNLEAYIEASPILMRIDKKFGMAKCADYQLLGSLSNNKLLVTNLKTVIGRITTRCLKLTIVNNLNCSVTFGRIAIKLLNAN